MKEMKQPSTKQKKNSILTELFIFASLCSLFYFVFFISKKHSPSFFASSANKELSLSLAKIWEAILNVASLAILVEVFCFDLDLLALSGHDTRPDKGILMGIERLGNIAI
jgi:hypothetical protein